MADEGQLAVVVNELEHLKIENSLRRKQLEELQEDLERFRKEYNDRDRQRLLAGIGGLVAVVGTLITFILGNVGGPWNVGK